ncbi:hypothetical protein DMC01_08975 [Campylobacter troglodytis]|nr:hypothetical protein DMC01_08975 [Campylobacter troglodytis]
MPMRPICPYQKTINSSAPSFNAHSACINYLKKCGCNIMRDHFPFIKEHYIYNYNEALKNKQVVINLTCEAANESYYKELQKLILMLDHNTPILHLVRDPIERLLSALNGNIVKPNLIYNFTHKTPLSALEDRVRGWINKDLRLEDRIKNIVNRPTFHLIKLYEFFLKYNFTKHDFLDLCKYKKEDELFELFTTLSKSYNFQPPRHKEDLSYKYHSLYVGFLPLSYTVNGIKFTLSCQKMDQIEITEILNLSKNELTRDILIYIEACNLKKMRQNANELRLKIQAFLDKLREVLEIEVKFKRTNKEGLFEFLKTKPDLRRLLRDIFDKDLEYIGQARPDIVASWDYYNEFKALCEKCR